MSDIITLINSTLQKACIEGKPFGPLNLTILKNDPYPTTYVVPLGINQVQVPFSSFLVDVYLNKIENEGDDVYFRGFRGLVFRIKRREKANPVLGDEVLQSTTEDLIAYLYSVLDMGTIDSRRFGPFEKKD